MATIILIISCIVVYGLSQGSPEFFRDNFALAYFENERFRIWQTVTHLFMHGGTAHLLFNMFGLWSFGTTLERFWGTKRFLIFYVIAGIGAAVIYSAANYLSIHQAMTSLLNAGVSMDELKTFLSKGTIRENAVNIIGEDGLRELFLTFQSTAVGASGAIYGILVAFALMFPNHKLALIFLPVPIAAKFFVPVIIGFDLFFGISSYSVGNIAHFAHIGGAVIGFSLMMLWKMQGYDWGLSMLDDLAREEAERAAQEQARFNAHVYGQNKHQAHNHNNEDVIDITPPNDPHNK